LLQLALHLPARNPQLGIAKAVDDHPLHLDPRPPQRLLDGHVTLGAAADDLSSSTSPAAAVQMSRG
jgi:hypothetical protein